jgi:hypothetical protein
MTTIKLIYTIVLRWQSVIKSNPVPYINCISYLNESLLRSPHALTLSTWSVDSLLSLLVYSLTTVTQPHHCS